LCWGASSLSPRCGERVARTGRSEPGEGQCTAPHPTRHSATRYDASTSPRNAGRGKQQATAPIRMSNSHGKSPVLFVRPRVSRPSLPPANRGSGSPSPARMPRVWRADGRDTSSLVPYSSLEKHGRLSARHSGVVSRRTGHAFENVDQPRLSASSWRQVLVPASGAPSPPGDSTCVLPNPRAPHPLPSIETPRDDAPG